MMTLKMRNQHNFAAILHEMYPELKTESLFISKLYNKVEKRFFWFHFYLYELIQKYV